MPGRMRNGDRYGNESSETDVHRYQNGTFLTNCK